MRTILAAVPCTALLVLLGLLAKPTSGSGAADPQEIIDVWMVPHAHCDVGWLMSVDGYFNPNHYDGSENTDSVSNILTTVTQSLDADPELRFIWSETKWIEMWWPKQTAAMQAAFKRIIKSGQLEIVGGGWSQNDEVTTAYYDVIDNQVTGHEFLKRTGLLDECPQPGRCIRFGWQIDMFAGFSGATANLWAMAGYDGMFLRWEGTEEQKAHFLATGGYEWLWESSASLTANRSRIWTHSMYQNYGSLTGFRGDPPIPGVGFDWDDGGGAMPVNASNVGGFATAIKQFVTDRKVAFQGPILAVWGSDYR